MRKVNIAVMLLLGVMLVFGLARCGSSGPWQLTVIVEGQGSVVPSSGTFNEGEEVIFQATPSSGWIFNRWEGAFSGTGNRTSWIMHSDATVEAYFIPITPTPTE